MIVFPHCKINLGLQILRKRSDGFHDLSTIFYPVPLNDILEIITDPHPSAPLHFTQSGDIADTPPGTNLCEKAIRLLAADFPQLPSLRMHLHKQIPSGAGLGGGSSDAAFTLRLCNEKYKLGLDIQQLQHYALMLGSDAPFFITDGPAYAGGRGEILEPVSTDLSGHWLCLVNPRIHIATAWAFSKVKPDSGRPSIKETIDQPIESWKGSLENDFEIPVFEHYPEIGNIRSALYDAGASYASLSGSGATVFGIFREAPAPVFPPHYFVRSFKL